MCLTLNVMLSLGTKYNAVRFPKTEACCLSTPLYVQRFAPRVWLRNCAHPIAGKPLHLACVRQIPYAASFRSLESTVLCLDQSVNTMPQGANLSMRSQPVRVAIV